MTLKDQIDYEPKAPTPQKEQEPQSDKQRLRIHVPYLKTTLTMGEAADGEKIRPEDRGDMNFPGFGVTTTGHVFIDANGDGEGKGSDQLDDLSMMRLQSKGHLTVQTPSWLAMGGAEGAILASQETTTIAGGSGVAIFGGKVFPWSDNQVNDAKSPDSPEWITSIEKQSSGFNTFWNFMDVACTAFGLAQGAVSKKIAGYDNAPRWATFLANQMSFLGGVSSLDSVSGGLFGDELSVNPSGGTLVHGTSGLLLGSGLTAGLYSMAGTTIATPAAVSVSGSFATTWGKYSSVLSSTNHASVQSEAMASFIANDNALVTAREGVLTLGGPTISMGIVGDLDDSNQKPTTSISIAAKTIVLIDAEDVAIAGGTASLAAETTAMVSGVEGAFINGGKGLVMLNADEATIGLCSSAPDLAAITTYRDDLASLQKDHEAISKKLAMEKGRDDYKDDFWQKLHVSKLEDYESKLSTAIDAIKGEIEGLSMGDASIKFEDGKATLKVGGYKLKVEESKAKFPSLEIKK